MPEWRFGGMRYDSQYWDRVLIPQVQARLRAEMIAAGDSRTG
jgi:hypothetical protein